MMVMMTMAQHNENMHRNRERSCGNQGKEMPVYSARVVNESVCVFFNLSLPFGSFCAGDFSQGGGWVSRGRNARK